MYCGREKVGLVDPTKRKSSTPKKTQVEQQLSTPKNFTLPQYI
jgi:hypothetical protein